jgi:hypothetical protein
MRKTPRTDTVWERIATDTTGELEPDVEFSTLARELEHELNNALEKINRLEEAGQRVDDAAHSIQDWSGTVLGDALDELNKAKEDKP